MGSKSRIAKDIMPIIQKCIYDNKIDTYIEPFVGGSNMNQRSFNTSPLTSPYRWGYFFVLF